MRYLIILLLSGCSPTVHVDCTKGILEGMPRESYVKTECIEYDGRENGTSIGDELFKIGVGLGNIKGD